MDARSNQKILGDRSEHNKEDTKNSDHLEDTNEKGTRKGSLDTSARRSCSEKPRERTTSTRRDQKRSRSFSRARTKNTKGTKHKDDDTVNKKPKLQLERTRQLTQKKTGSDGSLECPSTDDSLKKSRRFRTRWWNSSAQNKNKNKLGSYPTKRMEAKEMKCNALYCRKCGKLKERFFIKGTKRNDIHKTRTSSTSFSSGDYSRRKKVHHSYKYKTRSHKNQPRNKSKYRYRSRSKRRPRRRKSSTTSSTTQSDSSVTVASFYVI